MSVKTLVDKLLLRRFPAERVRELVHALSEGRWTHNFPTDVDLAQAFDLPCDRPARRGPAPHEHVPTAPRASTVPRVHPRPLRRPVPPGPAQGGSSGPRVTGQSVTAVAEAAIRLAQGADRTGRSNNSSSRPGIADALQERKTCSSPGCIAAPTTSTPHVGSGSLSPPCRDSPTAMTAPSLSATARLPSVGGDSGCRGGGDKVPKRGRGWAGFVVVSVYAPQDGRAADRDSPLGRVSRSPNTAAKRLAKASRFVGPRAGSSPDGGRPEPRLLRG